MKYKEICNFKKRITKLSYNIFQRTEFNFKIDLIQISKTVPLSKNSWTISYEIEDRFYVFEIDSLNDLEKNLTLEILSNSIIKIIDLSSKVQILEEKMNIIKNGL